MVKKYVLSARPSPTPITEPVTKLGGQPVWLGEPCWPLSKALGEPMRFIGQFVIYPEIFGACEARMAYLFMTESDTDIDGTWIPDGGENAVILQPGVWSGSSAPLRKGPTLSERIFDEKRALVEESPREYAVELRPDNDPEQLDESEFEASGNWDRFCAYVEESKIGGTPAFLQHPEYPDAGMWRLLVQINSTIVPAGPNFGDAGIGYAFLSEDMQTAKFLWQCS